MDTEYILKEREVVETYLELGNMVLVGEKLHLDHAKTIRPILIKNGIKINVHGSKKGQRICKEGCTCKKHSEAAKERAREINRLYHPGPQKPPVPKFVLLSAYNLCGNLEKTGMKYGVSGVTILRWMEYYGLPRQARGSWKHSFYVPTSIEIKVREYLDSVKIKWESDFIVRGFHPDLYLPNSNTLIEAHGCYWHNCKEHFPNENIKQRIRDKQKLAAYYSEGYNVLVLWEHEINSGCFSKIKELV